MVHVLPLDTALFKPFLLLRMSGGPRGKAWAVPGRSTGRWEPESLRCGVDRTVHVMNGGLVRSWSRVGPLGPPRHDLELFTCLLAQISIQTFERACIMELTQCHGGCRWLLVRLKITGLVLLDWTQLEYWRLFDSYGLNRRFDAHLGLGTSLV